LGWLRAAPSVGAVLMALTIAHTLPFKRAGRVLLWAVVVFGVATIVFGLSRNFYLSLAALLVLGAADNISVVIRHSLLLLRTPDAMRGRIAAVNGIFISASNELGGFESGLVAWLFTPVISVVLGGVGTIVVVLAVALLAPEMRNLGALAPSPEAEESLVREAEFEATAQEPLVD
jgi:MFS family permease